MPRSPVNTTVNRQKQKYLLTTKNISLEPDAVLLSGRDEAGLWEEIFGDRTGVDMQVSRKKFPKASRNISKVS